MYFPADQLGRNRQKLELYEIYPVSRLQIRETLHISVFARVCEIAVRFEMNHVCERNRAVSIEEKCPLFHKQELSFPSHTIKVQASFEL